MNCKIICNWLGIADWPPDHHALLGLEPEERDAARIEQRVQERMAKLRCYQLSHPEEATEGMNRVAQAFICLTEALVRQPQGNNESVGLACRQSSAAAVVETQPSLVAGSSTEIDWQNLPPPVRIAKGLDVAVPPPAAPSKPIVVGHAKSQAGKPVDIIFELAHESQEARRGLRTLAALIERVNRTRKLIIAWNQAGKYLSNTGKKLCRPAEETELTRRLRKVFDLCAEFPKIVGHPGQPGYRVVAMARLEMTAQMFKMLDKNQRVDLARDWDSGYRVLLAHRRFVHSQFKVLRKRGVVGLVLGAVRGALNDHPLGVSMGVLLIVGICVILYSKVF